VQVFAIVQRMDRLEVLDVRGCPQFTEAECNLFTDGLKAMRSTLVVVR